jgi:subtilisin family serine protease
MSFQALKDFIPILTFYSFLRGCRRLHSSVTARRLLEEGLMNRFVAAILAILSSLHLAGGNCGASQLISDRLSTGLAQMLATGETQIAVVAFLESTDLPLAANSIVQPLLKTARSESSHTLLLDELKSGRNQHLGIVNELEALQSAGQIKNLRRYWIADALAFTADADVIESLLEDHRIRRIVDDRQLELVDPVSQTESESGLAGSDNAMAQIGARAMWNLGYTGHGRLICSFDTGVEGTHPALFGNWRGNDSNYTGSAWFDPYGSVAPVDLNGHGTHTMGLMVGKDGADTIGVAFNAQWISAGVIDRGQTLNKTISDILGAFQWAADPDGNPLTVSDLPDVLCNSWGIPKGLFEPCDNTFFQAIDNLEALGVVVIFAGGNEGPNFGSMRNPADRTTSITNSFAIGAVDQTRSDLMIANFSSRGPANCDTTKVKPDVVAPGVSLRSSYRGGGYRLMSGTSMAAPLVAGCVALMREYNPDATVEEIKLALIQSASDLGMVGKDNEYGWGFINVRSAIELLPQPVKPRIQIEAINLVSATAEFGIGATTPLTLTIRNGDVAAGQVIGTLRSSSPHVYILESQSAFGNLGGQGLGDNVQSPFMVKVDHLAQPGDAALFTIDFSSQQFSYLNSIDFELIFGQPTVAGVELLSTPRLNAEVTNFGVCRRMYDYAASVDLMSHFGLLFATNDGAVYDAMPGNFDFRAQATITKLSAADLTVVNSTLATANGLLTITQEVSASSEPVAGAFMLYHLRVANSGGSPLRAMGLSIDADLPAGEVIFADGSDVVVRNAAYNRYVGVRLLPAGDVFAQAISGAVYKSGAVTDADRWQTILSGAMTFGLTETDQAAIVGIDLNGAAAPEDFGFVVASGNSLDEIRAALQSGAHLFQTATDVDDEDAILPTQFALGQNFPNPFNAETRIDFSLPQSGSYRLAIINALGQTVRSYESEDIPAGNHHIVWDGRDHSGVDVASGAYFYRLEFGGRAQVKRMVLLK